MLATCCFVLHTNEANNCIVIHQRVCICTSYRGECAPRGDCTMPYFRLRCLILAIAALCALCWGHGRPELQIGHCGGVPRTGYQVAAPLAACSVAPCKSTRWAILVLWRRRNSRQIALHTPLRDAVSGLCASRTAMIPASGAAHQQKRLGVETGSWPDSMASNPRTTRQFLTL